MSTISQSVLDKLRDDITEVVSFWNTISAHRNLRSELSAGDIVALIDIIDLYKTHEILTKEEETPPVPYVLPTNISTETLAYKPHYSPKTYIAAVKKPPIKKPKGKKK